MLKQILVTVALMGVTAASYGQGTVTFANQGLSTGDAPVTLADGTTRLSGTNFSAQLYSAPGFNAAVGSLTAAESRVQFRALLNAGFVPTAGNNSFTGSTVDPEVTVVAVAGAPATVQMRAWESRFPTYEAAVAGGGLYGFSNPLNITTGGGVFFPAELAGLQGFSLVPEPSTLALGALGLAALLFRRRK